MIDILGRLHHLICNFFSVHIDKGESKREKGDHQNVKKNPNRISHHQVFG